MSLKLRARLALLPLGLAGLGLAAAHPAQAQTNITVNNASFDSGGRGTPPGFTSAPGTKVSVVDTPVNGAGLPSTDQDGGSALITQGSIFQNTGTALKIGDTYTLSGYFFGSALQDVGTYSLLSFTQGGPVGGTILASGVSVPNTGSVSRSFQTFSLSFKDTTSGTIGLSLGTQTAGNPAYFDDIKLTDSPSAAPEPSQIAGLAFTAFGVLGLILKARKRKVGAPAA